MTKIYSVGLNHVELQYTKWLKDQVILEIFYVKESSNLISKNNSGATPLEQNC